MFVGEWIASGDDNLIKIHVSWFFQLGFRVYVDSEKEEEEEEEEETRNSFVLFLRGLFEGGICRMRRRRA